MTKLKLWKQLPVDSRREVGDGPIIKASDAGILGIRISLSDMMIIQTFVNECSDEISGLSQVGVSPNGFHLAQPFILDQPVTGVSTDITEAAATFLYELVKANQSPEAYKFWWHSHVDMNPFWSPTDEGTARGFNNVFMISMVINRRGEFMTRLDQFEPFRLTIYDLPLEVELSADRKLIEFCKEEIKKKIRQPFGWGGLTRIFTGKGKDKDEELPGLTTNTRLVKVPEDTPKTDQPAKVETVTVTEPAAKSDQVEPASEVQTDAANDECSAVEGATIPVTTDAQLVKKAESAGEKGSQTDGSE